MNPKGIILDLDNALYRDPADVIALYTEAASRLFFKIKPDTLEDSMKSARESFRLYGNEVELFRRQHDLAEDMVHRIYHEEAFPLFRDVVQPLPELHGLFNAQAGRRGLVILTHGSSYWAESMLNLLGLKEFFPDDRILALDHKDIGFRRKNMDDIPFRIAASRLGCAFNEIAMMDDTVANLEIPHRLGMHTVQVHWEPMDAPQSIFVNERSLGPVPYLKALPA